MFALASRFSEIEYERVPREQNVRADELVNEALDGNEQETDREVLKTIGLAG